MKEISITISGYRLDYAAARDITQVIAERDNPDTMLMAWFDSKLNRQSPPVVECSPEGLPGWEAYGKNHGGRLRISINDGEYVFIYT